jgi:hypothetical protein
MKSAKKIILPALVCAAAICTFAACSWSSEESDGSFVNPWEVCTTENNFRRVTTEGYFVLAQKDASAGCSEENGENVCQLGFTQNPGVAVSFDLKVKEGAGANQMERLREIKLPDMIQGDKYKESDFKLRAKDGSLVSLKDKVRITGSVTYVPLYSARMSICYMTIKKIERR